jgi:catechol 2,3-dioxygenase-like lactoylglutathione lyase family enzyme
MTSAEKNMSIQYSHIAIGVTNMARALPFYEALGFKVALDRIERNAVLDDAMASSGASEDRHVCYMRANDSNPPQFLSLHYRPSIKNKPLKAEEVGINHASIWVQDMDRVLSAIQQAGGTIVIPPFVAEGDGWTLAPGHWVRSTFLGDPDGTLIQLDQIVPEPKQA